MKALLALAFTAALSAGTAYADCSYPAAPANLPDGRTATLEEMVAGQKTVKEYDTAIKAYVDCIDKELDDTPSPRRAIRSSPRRRPRCRRWRRRSTTPPSTSCRASPTASTSR